MTTKSEQQRLNEEIAYELDKYQVMLEYGRIYLDEDKAIRKKYEWMKYAKKGCLSGIVVDAILAVATQMISSEYFSIYLPYFLIVLVLGLLLYLLFLFMHRKRIAKLISAEEKGELKELLANLHSYLHKLGEWMKNVDSHIEQKKSVLDIIEKDLAVAKSLQAKEVNKLSEIYGELDKDRDAKARMMAEERLQQYKRFIYDYE